MPSQMSEQSPRDITFRNFSNQQASDYATGRLGYSKALVDGILDFHQSTGGQNGIVLDVGCGPGIATRILAPHFDVAYGADPGQSMIDKAQELGGQTRINGPIVYELSSAETIDQMEHVSTASVDMITAATAAHWFDMPRFWVAAAKLLKPGGTVAIWTSFRQTASDKQRTKMQSIFDEFRDSLSTYATAGTHVVQNGYADLVLPWDNPDTASLYNRQAFIRQELSAKAGLLSDPPTDDTTKDESLEDQLQKLERLVLTLGSVHRWQKANPESTGTENDCVKILLRKVRETAQETGESLDMSILADQMAIALILVKRM
ncbi:trans-aconitate 3-methyltransferase [Fusarium heterosporum]|uniref:Trans-aconitate 3-methyltransferase n=1 Tax=Fusarium heterosporum TaxID=42747 RepID=A0A8H5SP12_FUSHE|nr:trans-aconitate 3-methyltransferase [Fusarium heterosporum]